MKTLFDDDGRPVQTVDFDYFDDHQGEPQSGPGPALERLSMIASRLMRSRTRQSLAIRQAALQWLANPIASKSDVARRLGITPRQFRRVVNEMSGLT